VSPRELPLDFRVLVTRGCAMFVSVSPSDSDSRFTVSIFVQRNPESGYRTLSAEHIRQMAVGSRLKAISPLAFDSSTCTRCRARSTSSAALTLDTVTPANFETKTNYGCRIPAVAEGREGANARCRTESGLLAARRRQHIALAVASVPEDGSKDEDVLRVYASSRPTRSSGSNALCLHPHLSLDPAGGRPSTARPSQRSTRHQRRTLRDHGPKPTHQHSSLPPASRLVAASSQRCDHAAGRPRKRPRGLREHQ
jgi:hypothetical protein